MEKAKIQIGDVLENPEIIEKIPKEKEAEAQKILEESTQIYLELRHHFLETMTFLKEQATKRYRMSIEEREEIKRITEERIKKLI